MSLKKRFKANRKERKKLNVQKHNVFNLTNGYFLFIRDVIRIPKTKW